MSEAEANTAEAAAAFGWVEVYESDVAADTLRRLIDARLTEVAEGVAILRAAIENGEVPNGTDADQDRADLAHVLANLNSAALHVGDYFGS